MKVEIDYATPEQWAQLSEKAHLIAFSEHKPREWDRIDFALLVRRGNQPMGYVVCREHDHETVYWAFGGAYPGTKDSSLTFFGYKAFVDACMSKYKRITTLIKNDNFVMLKMAMKVGFKIFGVRFFKGHVLLEHILESDKNEI
jgi:hypothetical protein